MGPSAFGWGIFLGFVLAFVGVLLWRVVVGRRQQGYLAVTEYWIYGSAERLPAIEKIMDRMVAANPHNRPGLPSIGAREGMLFSDLRLHMAVAQRERNPFAFRPDLFEEGVVPSAEALQALAKSTSLVKLRYASREPLRDDRHLQFMPHLADTLADLTNGLAVFDSILESLQLAPDFRAQLERDNRAARPELHLRVVWGNGESGYRGETRGLRKIGKRELRSLPQEADHEVLIKAVLAAAAEKIFRKPDSEWPLEVLAASDAFRLEIAGSEDGFSLVRILRLQPEASPPSGAP
ncbi:MAG: hypothetical protein KIT11_00345 [Fimbriimonadaceae bacterium]|nr:hypothetical protein [Fimbriimonadaceae bacterium]QYK55178.1 MAG: hypothetical protein KF733_09190 [Fimbriimonadaceae bacterium]